MSHPTPAQVAALEAFAAAHGRTWKSQLRHAWETGQYGAGDDAPALQQVRNTLGPSWLVRFRIVKHWEQLTKRTSDPKLAYLEAMLDKRGIPHRRSGESWHAPIMEVAADRLDEAWKMLSLKVAGRRKRLDDIDDDDAMFYNLSNVL